MAEVFSKRNRFRKSPDRIVSQRNDYRLHEHPHEAAKRLVYREGTPQQAAEIAWSRLQLQEKGSPRHAHWLAVLRCLRKVGRV